MSEKRFDLIVIGLGPAGMSTAIMGSAMGLDVLAVEKRAIGGECLHYGCIPSKGLLHYAFLRKIAAEISQFNPPLSNPFLAIRKSIKKIHDNKMRKMFEKVTLIEGKGEAQFVDSHTICVGKERYKGRQIAICTGSKPALPPIPGLQEIDYLTNETLFDGTLDSIPKSLFIIGGGAIGCEMAQAFSLLGSQVTLAHIDAHLLPFADPDVAQLLESELIQSGVKIYHQTSIEKIAKEPTGFAITLPQETLVADQLLVATGRMPRLEELNLNEIGIRHHQHGIIIDQYGRTSIPHIWAIGDCNGHMLFSHAAMHQGMLSLISKTVPLLGKWIGRYNRYPVPWAIFTQPEVAHVGKTERELIAKGQSYEVIQANYEDYGRMIVEDNTCGFVKLLVSPWGKIHGVSIIGAGASELIQEYTLAIQKRCHISTIAMTQHAFPSISLLNKRVAEEWMMKKMGNPLLQRCCRFCFRYL